MTKMELVYKEKVGAFFKRLICLGCTFYTLLALSQSPAVSVYIFLAEDCVISQFYTLPLRQLHQQYADSSLVFRGMFSHPASRDSTMEAFKTNYQLPFTLELDENQAWMHRFGIRVTPEVVVYDHHREVILYQGRIDDHFYQVGKRRPKPRNHELRDALESLKAGTPINSSHTQAVGCLITPLHATPQPSPH